MAADFLYLGFNLQSAEPLVGASGAIAGVIAAYFVLFRKAQLTFMLFIWQFKVSAAVWLGVWFLFQVVGALLDRGGTVTHVAYLAHVGGFVAGLSIIWPLQDTIIKHSPQLRLLRNWKP
jgi:membrane associated rhomboid family serine protease